MFFNSLYYTDVASALLVLSMYALSRRKQRALAGAAALLAVGVRQTNAIWVAFDLGVAALEELGVGRADGCLALARAALRRNAGPLLAVCVRWRAHLAVLAGFAAFVYANGGVTVGDKGNHEPVAHVAQLCYAGAFICLVTLPIAWPAAQRPARRREAARLLVVGAACALAIKYTARAHPFLLADNRHYTFYLWRRFLGPWPMVWVPVYAWSLLRLWDWLGQAQGHLWRLGYFAALTLTVVPSPLIEPRYYTIPAIMAILHAPRPPQQVWPTAALGILAFATANVLTWCIFLYRPFAWVDGSVARFMW